MAQLGVGTYRMMAHNAQHAACLKRALFGAGGRAGFAVVDTSPNYGDGLAETLVGEVLRTARKEGWEGRSEVEIISKFGFIQGSDLEAHAKNPWKGAVKYTDDCWHSLDRSLMEHQLEGSLQRLGVECIDTYLVHNPEHFLMGQIPPETSPDTGGPLIEALREQLAQALSETFEALEGEVQRGRIGSYGVSSNSFALPREHPHFVPFEGLLDLATEAARRVHGSASEHNFKTIEFPANIIERTALTPTEAGGNGCAQWAHSRGIRTVVNRALTAFDDVGSWRLAEAPFPEGYADSRDALIEHLSPPPLDAEEERSLSAEERKEWDETLEACHWLRQLVTDLDAQIGAFSSVMHYQDDLMRKVVPMINAKLDGMDEDTSARLFGFFAEYEQAVRSVTGQQTRTHIFESISQDKALAEARPTCDPSVFIPPELPVGLVPEAQAPLQEYALAWLARQPCVSTILVGAVRESYVDEAARVVSEVQKNHSGA
ncbi:Aldose reductase B [Hondaea fermentalgiana]|uniref:Aldose reductase B n=1 Tax=Hondaea fermentalgiana TaxID=2315210 RepID=A0A2R5GDL8_9STRA|nr:Aldose reductase B [Hondaea fermentalgiana]|eukprot:GBG29046.1 Aldose reductase B [Hondaea fermentalgiana]